jgi:hypothetical protein
MRGWVGNGVGIGNINLGAEVGVRSRFHAIRE